MKNDYDEEGNVRNPHGVIEKSNRVGANTLGVIDADRDEPEPETTNSDDGKVIIQLVNILNQTSHRLFIYSNSRGIIFPTELNSIDGPAHR